ncbi:MAG TPA: hypothetical protein VGS20_01880 [Candidatus Acidoferrales bacterium]|nr:hypothetical protein [Candidatus Acidoferrales bacterium]
MRVLHIVFIVGAVVLAFSVTGLYPVVGAGTVLLGVGILLVFAAGIVTSLPKDTVGPMGVGYVAIIFLPWLLAGVLVANGSLDRSREMDYETTVLSQDFSRSGTWDYLKVQSWRPGHSTETLFIKLGFSFHTGKYYPGTFYFPGEPITVGVKAGALRMPWICRVSQGHSHITYPEGPSG